MNWAASIRRDYIFWRLATQGEINRNDIIRHFGVSMPQASVDINSLLADRPDSISYDKSRKRYIAKRHQPAERLSKLADALGWD